MEPKDPPKKRQAPRSRGPRYGYRAPSGRPVGPKHRVHHRPREDADGVPCHVTMKVRRAIGHSTMRRSAARSSVPSRRWTGVRASRSRGSPSRTITFTRSPRRHAARPRARRNARAPRTPRRGIFPGRSSLPSRLRQPETSAEIGQRVLDAARLPSGADLSIQRRSASRLCDHRIERLRRSACRWRARPSGGPLGRARESGFGRSPFITSSRARRDQRRGGGIVEHRELAGHVGLERKLVQQPLAEGMDRLDFQAARRLQRLGEEPPRLRASRRRSARAPAAPAIAVGELSLVKHRPLAERLEDAPRHFRRGDLCEGQAEDRRRDRRRRAAGG